MPEQGYRRSNLHDHPTLAYLSLQGQGGEGTVVYIADRGCLLLSLQSVGSPITSIYFDTPDFYCLAGDTRVTLASGVSMRIADLKELPQVPT